MGEKALNVFTVAGRVFGWGMLGAICGVCLALVTGLLHLPTYEASNPLANEWYPVGVILTMFFECCVGFLLGAAIAAAIRRPWARKKAFLLAIVGAVVGVSAVRLVPDLGDDALVLSMYAQAVGILVSWSVGGPWWAGIRRLRGGRE